MKDPRLTGGEGSLQGVPPQGDTDAPSGILAPLKAKRREALRDVATLDLFHELASRLLNGEPYPSTEEGIAVGKLLQDRLAELSDLHSNRFSFKRLQDYYHFFLRPNDPVQPPLEGCTWLELGCGSQNPLAFSFLLLLMGARKAIAVDLDPVQDESIAMKALSDITAMMLVDPKRIADQHTIDRHQILRNIASFDLSKLRVGDKSGLDQTRLLYMQEKAENLPLQDSSINVIVSNSFLEHVADLDAIVSEMSRLIPAGGMAIHAVDGSDHRRYADQSVHPLAFLEIKDDSPIVAYSNRIRPLTMNAVFEKHGFELLRFETWERTELTAERKKRFVEPFRSLSQEELEVVGGIFVWRRLNTPPRRSAKAVSTQQTKSQLDHQKGQSIERTSLSSIQRLKLALLSFEYPPETGFGGIGTYTWYQARALAKLGHDVHVISGATKPTSLRMEEKDGVKVYRFRDDGLLMRAFGIFSKHRMWWTRKRLENALCMFRAFSALSREHKYDLVEMPECGAEGMLINHFIRAKSVVKFHSPCQLIMQYYYSRDADIRACSFLERTGMRGATAYSTPSRFLAEEARGTFGIQKPIKVLPYGIDLELFDQQDPMNVRLQFGIPANRPIILFSSRMEPRKGILLCKDIVHSILSRYEVAFVFAGQDLFGHMADTLLPFWKSQNYRGSVHYLGRVELSIIRSFLREAQILLLPSIWDNTPYSCMEAMSSRCAIVGSDHGGIPELIQHETSGLLVKNGDVASYVATIERLIDDQTLRERLGAAARHRIEQSFNDIHIAQLSTDYYHDVLNGRSLHVEIGHDGLAPVGSGEGR